MPIVIPTIDPTTFNPNGATVRTGLCWKRPGQTAAAPRATLYIPKFAGPKDQGVFLVTGDPNGSLCNVETGNLLPVVNGTPADNQISVNEPCEIVDSTDGITFDQRSLPYE